MRQFLLAASLLILGSPPAFAGSVSEPRVCCACERTTPGPALFCRRVPLDDLEALSDQCKSQGGGLVCEALPVGQTSCTFESFVCPAAQAPALDSTSLGTLAVMLAGIGVVTVRRRSHR